MRHYKLAFLGFGNVGQALARLLLSKRQELVERQGITFQVVGVATSRHGSAISIEGLNLEQALALAESGSDLGQLTTQPVRDNFEFVTACGADILFENTPVNYASGQPAIQHLQAALTNGMHAITANKGPVVHAYRDLTKLAHQHGRKFFFESTVMDGAPIFSLFRTALPGATLLAFRGVLNSTTNMILSRMEMGERFEDAVRYTQQIGIAETDPSGDIDGWDAAIKVAALVNVLMEIPLKPAQVDRTGIREITTADIQSARAKGQRYKLVCSAVRSGDEIQARVAPELVPQSSPLFAVEGTSSMITFETDVLGPLSILEENPGPDTTAYGLFADFLNAVRDA
jgi:homoserine dehydrogenase